MQATALTFFLGLLAGAALFLSASFLAFPWLRERRPCIDVYTRAPGRPVVFPIPELYQHDYGRSGLAHITVAGARHHGMRRVELWMQTFAPGTATPVHRHNCEEVFVILRGTGTVSYRASNGSVERLAVRANDTLVLPPNVVHQIRNDGESGDLQALVVFASPPISIKTFANWSVPERQGQWQKPYYWDRSCPPVLPAALQRLAGGGGGGAGEQAAAAAAEGGGTAEL